MTDTLLPRTIVAQRFVIESRAGGGGMGTVYRAIDTLTGSPVALKVMGGDAGAQDALRFAREARLLAELRHPGIVAHVASGQSEDGRPYLAMEWLEGEDLAHRLRRQTLTVAEAIHLVRGVAAPLAAAHEHGIVHRDIKPSNIFLCDGDVRRVILLDFGIARQTTRAQALTASGAIVGSPVYMAPEQVRGQLDIGPRADVFALGSVLFECLTGAPPFAAPHLVATLAKIIFEEPPALCRLRPDVPDAVEAIVARMLQKDPALRPGDATELAALLEPLEGIALDGAAPSAPAVGFGLGDDLRLVSVVIGAPHAALEAEPTMAPGELERQWVELRSLRDLVAAAGAHVDVLAHGALVATLTQSRGAATDQAVQAAHCAAQIKARWPGALVVVTTGKGLVSEGRSLGEALDRAGKLLAQHQGTATGHEHVVLDDVTAGLLGLRLGTTRLETGAFALDHGDPDLDEARPLLGKPTPCVGRELELAVLEAALLGCTEGPTSRALLVTGPPGAGKSRLRHEFVRRVKESGENVTIMSARGEVVHGGAAHPLIGQAIRRLAGAGERDDLEARRRALGRRVAAHLPAGEARRATPFLGELAGAPFPDDESPTLEAARQDGRTMGNQIRQALIEFLRAECEAAPVVLVLEDLHWGDALTVDLVSAAMAALLDRPFLVVAFARPEVTEIFPRLFSRALHTIPLRPLSRKAGEKLVRQVLGSGTPAEVVARIVERSAGNALYLEELIRSAAAGEGDEVPETVLAMLQGRITRLDLTARRVLQAASVFGDSFSAGGVRAVLGAAWQGEDVDGWIAALAEREIVERRQSAATSEPTYRFRHALMRDAAYGLLTDDDRQLGHRSAGQYLEDLRDARPTLPSAERAGASHHEDDEILARHFHEGRAWERALRYTVRAAEKAAAAYANQDALRLYARALEICGHVGQPRRTVEVLQKQAMVHLQAGDFAGARSDFEQIVQVAVQISDRGLEGAMLTLRGMAEHFQHDFAASERTLRAALAIGEDGFPGVRFGAAAWLGAIYLMLDRHAEAAPLLSEAERLAPAVEDPFHQAWWGMISGSASIWRGRFTEALTALERWRGAAEASRQALLSLWTLWLEAMACGGTGKYQRAMACLDDAIVSARRVGEPMIIARALNTMGWIHGELGDLERALAWNERGVEAARQLAIPSPEILSNALLNVADDLRGLGRLDEAEQVLRTVAEIIEDARRQDPYLLWRYSLHFLSSSAELALARGDHGRALDLADRCRCAAEDSKSLKYRVKATRLRGRILAATGRTAEADQDLALALALARQLGNPLELTRTLDALAPVHEALARADAARAARREAGEIIRAVADELTDPSLRAALLRTHEG